MRHYFLNFSYLATGDSYNCLATRFYMGVYTVSNIVSHTCQIIWEVMSPVQLKEPNVDEWKRIEKGFSAKWSFPNCIGALDGKHIVIQAPHNSGSLFFNYKGTFSLVLMALVDADYRFVLLI